MSFLDKVLRYINERTRELDITGTLKILEERRAKARLDLNFIRSLRNSPAILKLPVAEALVHIRKGAQSPLLLAICNDFAEHPDMIKEYTTVNLLEALDKGLGVYVS